MEDFQLYQGKQFSELLQDIYNNSAQKRTQINKLIMELNSYISSPTDAAMMIPLLTDYIEVGVKNDELLIKMAQVAQRHASGISKNNAFGEGDVALTEEEKQKLRESVEEFKKLQGEANKEESEIDRMLKEIDSKKEEVMKNTKKDDKKDNK